MTFEEFLATRLPALLRYATVVTCDRDLAQDVVQEVLLRAHGRWSRIGGLDAPEPYLRRMVLNEFLSWRRRRAAASVEPGTFDGLRSPDDGPDGEHAVDERDAVLRLLRTLPPRQRAVLALRYYEDLPDAEIAVLMGCRPVTVRTQASRALATLRRTMPALPVRDGRGGPR